MLRDVVYLDVVWGLWCTTVRPEVIGSMWCLISDKQNAHQVVSVLPFSSRMTPCKELWLFVFLFYLFKIRPYKLSMGFLGGSAGKEPTCNVGDLDSIPGLWRSPEEWKAYPLQYSGLKNSGAIPWGRKESDTTEQLSLLLSNSHYGYEMVDFPPTPSYTHTFRVSVA